MMNEMQYINNCGIGLAAKHLTPDQASHSYQFRNKQQEFIMQKLTQERLKELLHYNSETGVLVWKVDRNGTKGIKSIAGNLKPDGYIQVMVDGKNYKVHRLIWLYIYGYFPEHGVDHINRNPGDNRIENLREASNQCNLRNTGNFITNTSGVKGVCWDKQHQKWHVYIRINGKLKNLDYHKNFDDAVCARLAGEQCLDWSGCDSSSPAYKYVKKMLWR